MTNRAITEVLGPLAAEVPSRGEPLPKKRRRANIVHIRENTPKAMYKDGYVSPSEKEDRLVRWIGQYKAISKPIRDPLPEVRKVVPVHRAPTIPVSEVPADIRARFTEAMAVMGKPPIEKRHFISLMADFLTSPKRGFDEWHLNKAKDESWGLEERQGFLKELLRSYLHRVMQTHPPGLPVVERGTIQQIIKFWEAMDFVYANRLGVVLEKKKAIVSD